MNRAPPAQRPLQLNTAVIPVWLAPQARTPAAPFVILSAAMNLNTRRTRRPSVGCTLTWSLLALALVGCSAIAFAGHEVPATSQSVTVSRTIELRFDLKLRSTSIQVEGGPTSIHNQFVQMVAVAMDAISNPTAPSTGNWNQSDWAFVEVNHVYSHGAAWEVRLDREDSKSAVIVLTDSKPGANGRLDQVVARLRSFVAAEPHNLTPEQFHTRLKQIDDQIASAKDEMSKFWSVHFTQQSVRNNLMKDQMKALEMEKRQIQIDLRAKQARAAAVRTQIDRLNQQATTQASDDSLSRELRKAVDARQESVKLLEQMYKHGIKGPDEVDAAKAALADARTKLAEREEALRQSANAELINRLSSDLIMTAIDEAELKAKLAEVKNLLPPDDINEITQAQVDRLSAAYRINPQPQGTPPLVSELGRRQADLHAQRFGLLVSKIEVLNPSTHP